MLTWTWFCVLLPGLDVASVCFCDSVLSIALFCIFVVSHANICFWAAFFQLSLLPCPQQVQEVTGMVRKELCIHECLCQPFPSVLAKVWFWVFLLLSSFHLIWLVSSQPRSILLSTVIWITSFWTEISEMFYKFCCSVTYADTKNVEHSIHL